MPKKIAVVLFNLGGPDSTESVEPFLFNLFNDKAIISLPNPFRFLLAKFISSKRKHEAQEIYSKIGGKSPIVEETEKQAVLLESSLNKKSDDKYRVFYSMRYWHPFSSEIVSEVLAYKPDEVILLPLYPQFSTTTSGSSFDDWKKASSKKGLNVPTKTICCYPWEESFIGSHVALLRKALHKVKDKKNVRILFSAHGLPQKIVDAGDPYQWQIGQTVVSIIEKLDEGSVDWNICYQSKVGRLKWLEPSTEDEIKKAGKEKISLIVVPIAFVSEHSETLVELDIQYKDLAMDVGVKEYIRVPALSVEKNFIDSLAYICLNVGIDGMVCSSSNSRICPKKLTGCPSNVMMGNLLCEKSEKEQEGGDYAPAVCASESLNMDLKT